MLHTGVEKEERKEIYSDVTASEVDKTCSDTGSERSNQAEVESEQYDDTEEFFIDSNVDHEINKTQRH